MSAAGEVGSDRAGEDFAAPHRAVVAEAGAVEGEADHGFVKQAVLDAHRGDVRAMVLHLDER